MKDRIVVTYKGDYIEVLSEGRKDYQFANKLWAEVVKCCQKHNCYDVLGVARSSSHVPADDAYHHKDIFKEVGINESYRIAWVEMEKGAFNMAYFVENVLSNSGYNVRLYKEVSEAIIWLTSKKEK